jgi:hypothetical protein
LYILGTIGAKDIPTSINWEAIIDPFQGQNTRSTYKSGYVDGRYIPTRLRNHGIDWRMPNGAIKI